MLDMNFVDNEEITCPYCEYETIDTWEINDGKETDAEEYECENCGKHFYWSRSYTVNIQVAKSCKLNNEEHDFKHFYEELDSCTKCGETILKGK